MGEWQWDATGEGGEWGPGVRLWWGGSSLKESLPASPPPSLF